MSSRRLLVAIHDVTPAHARELARIYALLQELGIAQYALLVVPDWHGQWPLERHPRFADDLLARQEAGAEIFLHGYRHDEAGYRRSLLKRLRIAGRTARSAEFLVIPPAEADRRLELGLALCYRLGLQPVGFIPPAWLHGPGSLAALAQRGLGVTEGFARITNVARGAHRLAPALSFSTARRWRSQLTAGLGRLRPLLEARRPLVRVAIHPPDIAEPVVAAALRAVLKRLVGEREPTTYRSALDLDA